MANWTTLKTAIANVIKTNGNQEITGQLLQNVLNNIVSSVGANATFAGVATTSTNPGVNDGPVFYFANQAGVYANFGGIVVDANQFVVLYSKNDVWQSYEIVNTVVTTAKIADAAVTTSKLSADIQALIANIIKEFTTTEDENFVIEDNDGNVIAEITPNKSAFKNLKSNGKDVLTEHQDISRLATKEEIKKKQDVIPQIGQHTIPSSDNISEQIFASDEYDATNSSGEVYAKIGEYGIKAKAYLDTNGNPIPTGEPVGICCPNEIHILKGRTYQLFFSSLILAVDYTKYDINVECSIANKYARYIELLPKQEGDYNCTITVRDSNKKVLATKTVVIHSFAAPSSVKSTNVLCVGASATEDGAMPCELYRMLTFDDGEPKGLNYNNISFVGSHNGYATRIEYPNVFMEAHGGWSWNTYMNDAIVSVRMQVSGVTGIVERGDVFRIKNPDGTDYLAYMVQEVNLTDGVGNIRCVNYTGGSISIFPPSQSGELTNAGNSIQFTSWVTETFKPFIKSDGTFGFTEYAAKFCNNKIDVIITMLGVNSLMSEAYAVPPVIEDAKRFIEQFHVDFPNSHILINLLYKPSPITPASSQYGIWFKFVEYINELITLSNSVDYKEYVSVVPTFLTMDSEYCYPTKEKKVNTRSTITELVGSNFVHPTATGKYLMADAILPELLNIIK